MSGPQPIQIGEVMAYCAILGLSDPQDRMELLRAVQAMDGEFFKWVAEERKKAPKQVD